MTIFHDSTHMEKKHSKQNLNWTFLLHQRKTYFSVSTYIELSPALYFFTHQSIEQFTLFFKTFWHLYSLTGLKYDLNLTFNL